MARTTLTKRLKKFFRSPRNLLLAGTLTVLTITLLFANKGLWRHITLANEVADRRLKLAKLETDEASVNRQVALLRLEDASTIERIARERYHMKRMGETIYREDKN